MPTKRYTVNFELEVDENADLQECLQNLRDHIVNLVEETEMESIKSVHNVQVYSCDNDHLRDLHLDFMADKVHEAMSLQTLAANADSSYKFASYLRQHKDVCEQLFAALDKYIDDKLDQRESHKLICDNRGDSISGLFD